MIAKSAAIWHALLELLNSLELKIPPLVVTAFFYFLMVGARRLMPGLNYHLPNSAVLVWSLFLIALILASGAIWELRKAGTTANPLAPSRSSGLVKTGIFRLSRNPIYLGFLLALLGLAIATSNLAALALVPLFIAYLTRFQIIPEERALRTTFGEEFENYFHRVRRWL